MATVMARLVLGFGPWVIFVNGGLMETRDLFPMGREMAGNPVSRLFCLRVSVLTWAQIKLRSLCPVGRSTGLGRGLI